MTERRKMRFDQEPEPYSGPERRSRVALEDRVTRIEGHQKSMMDAIHENTIVTKRIEEILNLPGTFWMWCARWGKRISFAAKVVTPILAAMIALNQLLHIDIWEIIRRWLRF